MWWGCLFETRCHYPEVGYQYKQLIKWTFWVLASLAIVDVYVSMITELAMRFGATPTPVIDSFGGSHGPKDTTWCVVAYGLAAIVLPTGTFLTLQKNWLGAPVFILGVLLERLDWAFHLAVFGPPGGALPNIELVVFVLAAAFCALGWTVKAFEGERVPLERSVT
jgi:hypothetical protein